MTLDKKRLKELSCEIKNFIRDSFECEKDDKEAFDKEFDFFLDDFLEPAIEQVISDYLSYKKNEG